jgi:hypothetical protein
MFVKQALNHGTTLYEISLAVSPPRTDLSQTFRLASHWKLTIERDTDAAPKRTCREGVSDWNRTFGGW